MFKNRFLYFCKKCSTNYIYFFSPAPYVFIQDKKYEIFYGEQNSSVVILRQGVDISGTCTIWCWSHLLSHNKSAEIINSYYQITFEPFESSAVSLIIFFKLFNIFSLNVSEFFEKRNLIEYFFYIQ